ncbi:MAG: glycosyl hydrolase family 57 [Planctomycetes bacterium]|nr:glycosyl hydrolase family 57 [Planctomycetota bacterium]
MTLSSIPEYIDNLPNICGSEKLVAEAMSSSGPIYLSDSNIDFANIHSAFATALHMHQPLIPAGGGDLHTALVISNLKDMMDHPDVGDNHNAPVFHWCYQRIGRFVPQLVREGKQPRIMLDYSGCLLHGLIQMGLDDVIGDLRTVTCQPAYRQHVEWLGSPWGHSVAPSTPVQDYRLQVQAWQHFFAAVFGFEALGRVRGFSPSEMALPNHPDLCYEFVKTLKECGYRWVLVQEHTVERIEDGGPIHQAHIPHQLVAKNSLGQTISITAIIKTQGSDTKLVAQMQPYYEAMNLSGKNKLAGKLIPPLVTQIADGENGGVMMNEFPSKYLEVMAEASGTQTPAVNITEYLEYLETLGIRQEDFPAIQPIMQKSVWEQFQEGAGPEVLTKVIKKLKKQDQRFHMDGGSWTNNISWVRGYDHVIGPMESASALFAEKVLAHEVLTSETRYRNALYHLLMTQTSCFRYWGKGLWTDFGRELCRRTTEILKHDF